MNQLAKTMTAYARYQNEGAQIEAQQAVEIALERELRARGMHTAIWVDGDDERNDAIVELATDIVKDLGLNQDSWWDYLIESAQELCS
jgi:hypothetical protein